MCLRVLIGRGLFLLFLLSSLEHYLAFQFSLVGAYGNEVTPVPIPNTVVKLIHDDDTWLATARESNSVPAQD